MADVYREWAWQSEDGKVFKEFAWESELLMEREEDGVQYRFVGPAIGVEQRTGIAPFVHADWAEPILSDGLGVNPDQVPEAREYAARMGHCTEYTDSGQVVLRSHEHRKQTLRELGFVDKN